MPVTTMFYSDSTDKVRRYHNWCSSSHRHEMLEQPDGMYVRASDYYALQARYEALKAAGDGMAEILSDARQHMLDSAIGDGEKNLLIVTLDFAVQDYRAATTQSVPQAGPASKGQTY